MNSVSFSVLVNQKEPIIASACLLLVCSLFSGAVVSCQDSCNASTDHQTAFEEYGKMRHLEAALEVDECWRNTL